MDILKVGDAAITYIEPESKIIFEGSMRLPNMKEYDKIANFLKNSILSSPEDITLDLQNLQFLNSSGITTLSLFILHCKKNEKPKISVLGSDVVSWQQKSIANFKKLWNEVEIKI